MREPGREAGWAQRESSGAAAPESPAAEGQGGGGGEGAAGGGGVSVGEPSGRWGQGAERSGARGLPGPCSAAAVTWQQERPGSVSPARPPGPHGAPRAGCSSCPTAVPDPPHRAAITQPPRLPVEPRPLPSQELSAGGKRRARPFASLGPARSASQAAPAPPGSSFGLSARPPGRDAEPAAARRLAQDVIFYLPPWKRGLGIVRTTASVEGRNELVASARSEINK